MSDALPLGHWNELTTDEGVASLCLGEHAHCSVLDFDEMRFTNSSEAFTRVTDGSSLQE